MQFQFFRRIAITVFCDVTQCSLVCTDISKEHAAYVFRVDCYIPEDHNLNTHGHMNFRSQILGRRMPVSACSSRLVFR
jgi:hypothetical protein